MKFLKYISIILLTIIVGCNTEKKLPNEALSPRITVNSSEIPAQVALDFENNLTNTGTVAVNASTTGTPNYGTRPNNGGNYIFSGSNSLITDGYEGVNGKDARTMTAWIKPAGTGYESVIMSWGVMPTVVDGRLNIDQVMAEYVLNGKVAV